MSKSNDNIIHRFLDEAGDTTFYLKGKKEAIGTEGVSNCFILGMIKIKDPLSEIRKEISALQTKIANDAYLNVIPSIAKKNRTTGYYLHATDDPPEVRMLFIKLIQQMNCSFEAVVIRKSIQLFETRYKGKEEYIYADALSHLLKNKLESLDKIVLNISERGKCTRNANLEIALKKAKIRFVNSNKDKEIKTRIVFNVTIPTNDPLLNLADYFCWAIQRVFEKGDIRYYEYLKDKISVVSDIYDNNKSGYENGWRNIYNKKNPLTIQNKICPL
jgi:hypothetical protein